MNEHRGRVAGSRIFIKIDFKAGYNLIQIKPGNKWTIAFQMRYGKYKYFVLPCILENVPTRFTYMMNGIL
jgi:hypothetical protein